MLPIYATETRIAPVLTLDFGAQFEKLSAVKQSIVTLDMEGVLTPEIWIAVAEKTKIPELRRTTRDEPDYDKLMRGRLAILGPARPETVGHPKRHRHAATAARRQRISR